jgi:hypothetical protein
VIDLLELFTKAENFVQEKFPEDIEWSRKALLLTTSSITKQHFYAEYCFGVWVAGFKYSIVKAKWEDFTQAYFNFRPEVIVEEENAYWVKEECKKLIANIRKIDATIKCAKIINDIEDWQSWLDEVRKNIDKLKELPYVGDITKYQLARNIGVDCIKPDVHLLRLAKYYKMNVFDVCQKIADETGSTLHRVDTVIWRSCEQGFIKFR